MKWYFIVLLVIAYFIIGSILTGFMVRIFWDLEDDDTTVLMIFLWPIAIPLILLSKLCEFIYEMIAG